MSVVTQVWPEAFAARYRAAGYWRGETFGQMLRARALATPDALAVVDGSTGWSYAMLDARASRMASGLLERGIGAGDRVIVQLPNIAEFFSVVFGMFRAGIIPVFTLPAHRHTEVAHFASGAGAVAYVVAERHGGFDYRPQAAAVRAAVPTLRQIFVAGEPGDGAVALDELDAAPLREWPGPAASDVAFLQLSGGSTGLSKLIPRTHDDYLYSVRRSAEVCGLHRHSVYLGALPIAHNFPMSSPGTFGTLYAGGTVALSPSPSPDDAFPVIARHKVTIAAAVPPVALVWLAAAATTRHDLSSLQVLQIGGAKLTPEVARRVEPTLGVTLQQVFGMAEGLVNYTELDAPDAVKVFTQGRPMCADDEVLIVDDDGEPVAEGVAGHLLTRGPYTIRAYYGDADANARSFTPDGFYRTGDIVSQDAAGYLTVQGRATDHINRGGEKISAEEIEGHLVANPLVYDAVVVAVPDAFLGERTCAFVIARGEVPSAPAIKAWMRTRGLAAHKVPDQIVFMPDFPVTGVGKISRKDLRAALRARATASTAKV